jgi:membrane-associated phospholipid phosphatase
VGGTAAIVLLAMFVAWSAWTLGTGATWLDANATHVSGFVLRGAFDTFVSSLWPFGEPQLGALVAAALAAWLAARRRWRAAGLLVGCYAVLTAVELGLRTGIGLSDGAVSVRQALVHAYPSGHTARVPFLGTVIAVLAPRRLRAPILVATGALAVLVAFDRVDSTLQTASDVIGGTLLGAWLALSFAALLPMVERPAAGPRGSMVGRHDRT